MSPLGEAATEIPKTKRRDKTFVQKAVRLCFFMLEEAIKNDAGYRFLVY
jgi:hypothetical protein